MKEFYDKAREFMWDWDPLGVASDRYAIPEEYDGLAWSIASFIGNPKRHELPMNVLERISSSLGIPGSERDGAYALALQELQNSFLSD